MNVEMLTVLYLFCMFSIIHHNFLPQIISTTQSPTETQPLKSTNVMPAIHHQSGIGTVLLCP